MLSAIKTMPDFLCLSNAAGKSFSDFLHSRSELVELDRSSTTRMVRLRGSAMK
jgi:hypothetical protein